MMAGILAVVEGSLTDCSEGRNLRPFSAWSVAFGTTTTPQLMAGHLAVPSHFQPSARANDHEAPHEHGPPLLAGDAIFVSNAAAREGLRAEVFELCLALVTVRRVGSRVPGFGISKPPPPCVRTPANAQPTTHTEFPDYLEDTPSRSRARLARGQLVEP